ncbi:MAG: Membrane protein, GtrA superfamily [Candidatus Kaiserbacteria bacterium GW2011_GWB1_52_6]|uniref:Membrane protein, GtrA superfamily n=3 Tax=Candidatus Kaiseribacteriota TaxID=1752734 RepID=A0A0G1XHL9_9BACT|nr:MAG: Membrane protein, GtrA superfamily [Candidatus Kaiserbacteria bacterium GW2011_GWA2_52_12]KKW26473.1 MAG: Membrane protein, GtrA superfamily [Candidatus Kaiserbacteria bacterium GW2011_GWB1_52_6]KKW30451.1 MAG: Membrane protein, GtrA superfamily [Candidatus Kaiserbacteria bacterium GW2011_GWC2_52_8b]
MKVFFSRKFLRYGLIGILNFSLSIGIFNFFIWISGITRGTPITVFSAITFAIVVTHSFFWNKFHVFESKEISHRREYIMFFLVSGTVAIVNVGIISLLVNVIGAPLSISEKLWANIALCITIPVAVLGNFLGYSFIVFREKGPGVPVEPTIS